MLNLNCLPQRRSMPYLPHAPSLPSCTLMTSYVTIILLLSAPLLQAGSTFRTDRALSSELRGERSNVIDYTEESAKYNNDNGDISPASNNQHSSSNAANSHISAERNIHTANKSAITKDSPDRSICPVGCICSPTQHNHLKISCTWARIGGPSVFASFPSVRTHSLTIRCTDRGSNASQLPARTFATLTSLRHLTLRHCAIGSGRLASDLLAGLAYLKTFRFEGLANDNDRLTAEAGFLAGAKRLEKLSITGAGLRALPEGEVCGCAQLMVLNLTGNGLDTTAGAGLGAASACRLQLVMLDLSHNRISRLEQGFFAAQTQLHILHLEHNRVTAVPDGVLRGLRSLRKLSLSNNELVAFEDNVNDHLPHVKIVDLSANQLDAIPSVLLNSRTILRLNLSTNAIETLPSSGMSLPKLQALDLSNNVLTAIASEQFKNVTALSHLDLSNNAITTIDRYAIRDLDKLQFLSLADNRLSSVQHDSFFRLKAVSSFGLARNRLADLPDDFFSGMPRIRRLDLAGNRLSSVPTALTILYFIEALDLSSNVIDRPYKFLFDRLPNLATLDLSRNRLPSLDRYFLENVPKLSSLNLSYNAITSADPNCFHKTSALATLDMQGNRLDSLKGFLSNLPSLTRVNVSDNALASLDYSMIPSNLVSLDASNNIIGRLSNFLAWNVSIQRLDFSHNLIPRLDASVLPRTLISANFSSNRIAQLGQGSLLEMSALRSLDLRYNRLGEVNRSAVELVSSQKEVDEHQSSAHTTRPSMFLSGNPLVCSCETEWLRALVTASAGAQSTSTRSQHFGSLPDVKDLDQLQCRVRDSNLRPDGEGVSGTSSILFSSHTESSSVIVPLRVARDVDFVCRYESLCSGDCVCCDYESCDCKSVCQPGCACFRDATYTTNIVVCSNNALIAPRPSSTPEMSEGVLAGPFGSSSPWSADNSAFSLRSLPMYATEIRLDGVNIPTLRRHTFLGRFRLKTLRLNASHVSVIGSSAFTGLTALTSLDLSHNGLRRITGDEFRNVPNVRVLDLSHNDIHEIFPGAFDEFASALQVLKLHGNRLRVLPLGLAGLVAGSSAAGPVLRSVSLGGNPWACDCEPNGYEIQRWLPEHTRIVPDYRAVYCAEDLNDEPQTISDDVTSTNPRDHVKYQVTGSDEPDPSMTTSPAPVQPHSKVLRLLPPSDPQATVIKVNFWTFASEVVPQFCSQSPSSASPSSGSGSAGSGSPGSLTPRNHRSVLLIAALVTVLCFVLAGVIILIFVRFRGVSSLKRSWVGVGHSSHHRTPRGNKLGHKAPLPPLTSLDLPSAKHHDGSTGTSAGCSASSPLLDSQQYDVFMGYSSDDNDRDVVGDLARRLEGEAPYYEMCLLYRDVLAMEDPYTEHHIINDSLIAAMERSSRILLVLSEAFVSLEWRLVQIRTALQVVLRDCRKPRRLVVVLLGDVPLAAIDPMLGHYIRTNVCLQYDDSPVFWQKLREAMPPKGCQGSPPVLSLNRTSSTELYGTIVPSDFV